MEQQFLDGFLQAEAEARESMIGDAEKMLHLAKTALRYEKMQKVCKNESLRALLERQKQQIFKMMERH